jgi:cell wall-associated NlpC family hydrolase
MRRLPALPAPERGPTPATPGRRRGAALVLATALALATATAHAAPEAPAAPAPAAPASAPVAAGFGLPGAGLLGGLAGTLTPRMDGVRDATQGLVNQARETASDLVLSAMNFLGVPYRRGGTSADTGFDCSGFTRHVFEMTLGHVLPRRSAEQARDPNLLQIGREELKPGDLVFFNTLRSTFSHVGIYVGDHKFIHAPRAGASVRVEDMRVAYWTKRFNGARRVPDDEAAKRAAQAAQAALAAGATLPTPAEAAPAATPLAR